MAHCWVIVGAMLGDGWYTVGFWLAHCWLQYNTIQYNQIYFNFHTYMSIIIIIHCIF